MPNPPAADPCPPFPITRHLRGCLRVAAATVSLLLSVAGANADIELGHSGQTGRHQLTDIHDSPGAVCDLVQPSRDSLGEIWLRVTPPVIFARDRTDGLDVQDVGWRAMVSALDERTGAWHVVRQGEIVRDRATDDLATYFQGEGWLAGFPVSRASYAVSVEMLWYDPAQPAWVEGRATHAVEHYSVFVRHRGEVAHGRTASVCRLPR